MDRPVFKVVIFSECVVLISGIGMAPPSGMGGSETSEYSTIFVNRSLLLFVFVSRMCFPASPSYLIKVH